MTVQETFYKHVSDFVERINKGQNYISPINGFLSTDIFSSDFLFYMISSTPEVVFRKIGNHLKALKNQVEIWNPTNKYNINSLKGVLTCHALSPYGDTIFLIADIGRALRTAAVLKKDLHVMLADREWSDYNWITSKIGSHNLTRNITWRNELYKKIGASIKNCNLSNTPNDVKRAEIEEIGTAYEDLVRSIFGSAFIGRKLNKEESKNLQNKYKLYSNTSDNIDFLNIPLIKSKLQPEKEVIFNLLQTLRQFDQNTFIYYFTQRFHQYAYKDYLKMAVRSEKNFDKPFFALDKSNKNIGISFAIYFENYKMFGDTFVIPYYFPSGSLFETKEKIDEYVNQTLMLNDFDNKSKIIEKFKLMSYPYNARLLSDFMSFIHFLCFPIDNNQGQNEFRRSFRQMAKGFDKEFSESWNYYFKPPNEFSQKVDNWSKSIFLSKPNSKNKIPYYYFPFIELANNEPDTIDRYANFFASLLKKVVSIIEYPRYHKK